MTRDENVLRIGQIWKARAGDLYVKIVRIVFPRQVEILLDTGDPTPITIPIVSLREQYTLDSEPET